jgi:Flp pilus assembly protein TadG
MSVGAGTAQDPKLVREAGATLVEAAVTMMLVISIVFAIAEFGLAFRSWLTVSHGAREGARAGATFADNASADIEVLANIEQALVGMETVDTQWVRVYNDATGVGTTYTFTGTAPCRWSPCPDPDLTGYTVPVWNPDSRDVTAPFTDRIGVEIAYTHTWVTGFFRETSDFSATVVFQIEPQVFQ